MMTEVTIAQNKILRTALVQIINDPERAVHLALKAIDDCKALETKFPSVPGCSPGK